MFSRIFEAKNVLFVLNLIDISKEFFILFDLKITELTMFTTIQSPLVTFG